MNSIPGSTLRADRTTEPAPRIRFAPDAAPRPTTPAGDARAAAPAVPATPAMTADEALAPTTGHTPRSAVWPEAAPASVDPSPRLAAPPAIRIHIGRIEVRAVTPAPAARTQPRSLPPPALSLDEFLDGTRRRR